MDWEAQMIVKNAVRKRHWENLGSVFRACQALVDDGKPRSVPLRTGDALEALAKSLHPQVALEAAELFVCFAIERAIRSYTKRGSVVDVFLWADPETSPLVNGFPPIHVSPETAQVEAGAD